MSFDKIGRWKSGVKISHTKNGFPMLKIRDTVFFDANIFTSQKVDLRFNKETQQIAIISDGDEVKYFRQGNTSFQICSTRLSECIKKGTGSTPTEYVVDIVEGRKAIIVQIPSVARYE